MATLVSIGRLVIVAYVAYLLIVFVAQRRVAFPGTFRDPPRATPTPPTGGEQLWLDTSVGRVEAWLLGGWGASSGERLPAVIFAHGNGELIEDWWPEMEALARGGILVLLVEFPGYGHSEGRPTRETLRETYALAFDRLAARDDVDAARIVVWGRSMGGGVAADLAESRPVAALILQSTFSSAAEMARSALAPGFLVRDRFDVRAAVAASEVPVLLMHGRQDEVIPYAHAERIASARDGLRVTEIACGHNDCGRVWPDITATVTSFLTARGIFPDSPRG